MKKKNKKNQKTLEENLELLFGRNATTFEIFGTPTQLLTKESFFNILSNSNEDFKEIFYQLVDSEIEHLFEKDKKRNP
jgi:hypothetical protein